MIAYLAKVKETLGKFKTYNVQQVPKAENSNVDALTMLATSKGAQLLKLVLVEVLETPTIEPTPEAMPLDSQPSQKDSIVNYLVNGELPKNKQHAKRLKYQTSRYILHDNALY